MDLANFMNLGLSNSISQVPTRYSDNQQDLNLVINLIFLRPKSLEYNSYSIYLDWRLISNHTPLTINIVIFEEHIQSRKHIIAKNSKKEKNFIDELIEAIKELNTENISNIEALKQIVQSFANTTERI